MSSQAANLQQLMAFFTIAGDQAKGRQNVARQPLAKSEPKARTPPLHAMKKGNGGSGVNEADFARF